MKTAIPNPATRPVSESEFKMPRTPAMLFALAAALLCAAPRPAPAQSNSQNISTADRARQGLARQEQIQSGSQKLAGELNAMIEEYARNGLNGEDIKNLKSLKAILSRVSDKDMEKIVALLKTASDPADNKSSLKAISDAYSNQKRVLVELKQILASYAADLEAIDLADGIRQLADRQAANLQAGIETAQWSLAGSKPEEGAVDASLQAQAAEQKAVVDESKIFQDKIGAFAKKTNNKEVADRFNKGIEELPKIVPLMESAGGSLSDKKLFDAVGNEKLARDRLRQLARMITPPKETSELLREAALTLDRMISQQKGMLTSTKETNPKTIEQWLADELKGKRSQLLAQLARRPETAELASLPPDKLIHAEHVVQMYNNYRNTVMEPLSGLEDHEGDMANQADLLSQDLDKNAKPAADLLRSAIPPMQDARGHLNEKDSMGAAKSEESVIVAMEKAKASLDAQLLAAEKAEALSGDKAEALREIQKQTRDLENKQNELAKATAAPKTPEQAAAQAQKQAGLQQQAAQLQQQAKADAPAAADALGAASNNMKGAADTMNTPAQAPMTQTQQQLASQNLEKADQQLQQQINKLAQDQHDLDAAEKALQDLQAIIKAEQALRLATAKAAPLQAAQPDPVKALAPQQTEIQNNTAAVQKTVTTQAARAPQNSAGGHNQRSACQPLYRSMQAALVHVQCADIKVSLGSPQSRRPARPDCSSADWSRWAPATGTLMWSERTCRRYNIFDR